MGYATADPLRAHGPTLVFESMDDIVALVTADPIAQRLALAPGDP